MSAWPLEAESVRKHGVRKGQRYCLQMWFSVPLITVQGPPPQARYQLISKFRTATARAYYLTPEERTRMLATFVGKL